MKFWSFSLFSMIMSLLILSNYCCNAAQLVSSIPSIDGDTLAVSIARALYDVTTTPNSELRAMHIIDTGNVNRVSSLMNPLRGVNFSIGYEFRSNFSADFSQSLISKMPVADVNIVIDIAKIIEERQSMDLIETITTHFPQTILFNVAIPQFDTIWTEFPSSSKSLASYNMKPVLYWKELFCVKGYSIDVIKTLKFQLLITTQLIHDISSFIIFTRSDLLNIYKIEDDVYLSEVDLSSLSASSELLSIITDSQQKSMNRLWKRKLNIHNFHPTCTDLNKQCVHDEVATLDVCTVLTGPDTIDASDDSLYINPIYRDAILHRLYHERHHNKLAAVLLAELKHLVAVLKNTVPSHQTLAVAKPLIGSFLSSFVYFVSRSDFIISRHFAAQFLFRHQHITTLMSIVNMNLDMYINEQSLSSLPFINFLLLYNDHSSFYIPTEHLYNTDVLLSSFWFSQVLTHTLDAGLIYENAHTFQRRLLLDVDARHAAIFDNSRAHSVYFLTDYLTAVHFLNAANLYFAASYIDAQHDRVLKGVVNTALAKILKNAIIEWPKDISTQRYDKPRVAIITKFWSLGHSSVRILRSSVASLRSIFHVTLITLTDSSQTSMSNVEANHYFDDIQFIRTQPADGFINDVNMIRALNFDILYYTDVGMYAFTTFLANKRLARIQIASYGHSVSTFGAKIDYWIGGDEVELLETYIANDGETYISTNYSHNGKPRLPNYSETLILIPGLGVVHDKPTWMPSKTRVLPSVDDNSTYDVNVPFIINCAWSATKLNSVAIDTLLQIKTRLLHVQSLSSVKQRDFIFRFFIGDNNMTELSALSSLSSRLGASYVNVATGLHNNEYLSVFQEGDVFLDSHHHGACNTLIDAFVTFTPIVGLIGSRWNNRIGPIMMKKASLDEYVVNTRSEEKTVIVH